MLFIRCVSNHLSPENFFSRLVNQLWDDIVGWKEIWTPHCTNLKQFIKLKADGELIDLPDNTEGLIFSNIPSFGGGMKLWNCNTSNGSRGDNTPSGAGTGGLFSAHRFPLQNQSELMHPDVDYLTDNKIASSSTNTNTGTNTGSNTGTSTSQ
jgi:hypothetical protein